MAGRRALRSRLQHCVFDDRETRYGSEARRWFKDAGPVSSTDQRGSFARTTRSRPRARRRVCTQFSSVRFGCLLVFFTAAVSRCAAGLLLQYPRKTGAIRRGGLLIWREKHGSDRDEDRIFSVWDQLGVG